MFGHVNNAAYLTYIESARVAYYGHLTGLKNPRIRYDCGPRRGGLL